MPFNSDLFSIKIWWNPVGGVYGITNVDRQVIFIGKTDDFERQMSEHTNDRNDCIHKYKPVYAYAEVIPNERERDIRAARLIDEYRPPCNEHPAGR